MRVPPAGESIACSYRISAQRQCLLTRDFGSIGRLLQMVEG